MGLFQQAMSGGSGASNKSTIINDDRKVYISQGQVVGCVFQQNAFKYDGAKFADEMAFRIEVNVGLDFNLEYFIGGSFQRARTAHGNGPISGLGSTFKLFRFLEAAGLTAEDLESIANVQGVEMPANPSDLDVDDLAVVFEAAIDRVIGSEILVLEYISNFKNGKLRYSRHDIVSAAYPDDTEATEKNAQALLKGFYQQVQKGYPKNFRPEVLDAEEEAATDFPPSNGEATEVVDAPAGW